MEIRFKSLFDFCARVDRSRINKRTVGALIKAGAFDGINLNRASLLASVDLAFEFGAAAFISKLCPIDGRYGLIC